MILLTLLALPLLMYLPGLLTVWAVCGRQQPADGLIRHFDRVLISALLSGWLALLLAELGIFSIWLLFVLLLTVCGCLFWNIRQRGSVQELVSAAQWSRLDYGYIAVLLLGGLLVARPFEVVLGGRDAGVYAVTGIAIARTGSIVQYDALLAELARGRASGDNVAAQAYTNLFSSQNPERFIATRLRAAGFFVNEGDAERGRVTPQFFHLFPAWIAIFAALLGPYGGLLATGLLATLGLWAVMMLGRTLVGPWVGLLAGLLLALNGVQVWFGRYSTSEAAAQFLTFAALYAFARWQAKPANAPVSTAQAALYAAIAGIAAGQLALTRIDFFLMVGPVMLFLVYSAMSRRWSLAHSTMLVALVAMLVHAGLHTAFIARAYFFDTAFARLQDYAIVAYLSLPFQTPVLYEIYYGTTRSPLKDPLNLWRELGVLALLVGAGLLLYHFPQPLRLVEATLVRWRKLLLTFGAVGVLLLGAYGYLVRPQILNADLLFNMRGGWGDPLYREPELLRDEVQRGLTGVPQARDDYGVVFRPVTADLAATEQLRTTLELGKIARQRDPLVVAADVDSGKVAPPDARAVYGVAISPLVVDTQATEALRAQLLERRGPWGGPFSNSTPNWLRLQGYIGAPVSIPPGSDPRYTVALANMVRVGWYLSPLGVALAVLGLALWLRRDLSGGAWLFLAVGLAASIFYIRQSYGTSDQTYIYILRRFMPVVYPTACLGMAYALAALALADSRLKIEDSQLPLRPAHPMPSETPDRPSDKPSTLHSSLFTLHSSLFTLHSSLFTLHPSLFTLHSSLFTLHSSLFTLHSSLFTLHSSLFTLESA